LSQGRVGGLITFYSERRAIPDASAPVLWGKFSLVKNCLLGVADGLILAPGRGNIAGTSAEPVIPQLGPLLNYGGPTRTMALLPGGAARDSSSNADAQGPPDQRGFARIVNGMIDI
jgi:hypothetical protein